MLGRRAHANQGSRRPGADDDVRGKYRSPAQPHLRLHQEARLVVRRSEAGVTHVGEGEEAGPQEHRCHKGIRSDSSWPATRSRRIRTRCATTSRSQFIAYHSAWPYQHELAALKGFKPQRKNLYAESAPPRRDGDKPTARVWRKCSARLPARSRSRLVMWHDSALWEIRSGDRTRSGHSGFPISSSRGTLSALTDELKAQGLVSNAARIGT